MSSNAAQKILSGELSENSPAKTATAESHSIPEIMARIREQVAADYETTRDSRPVFQPQGPSEEQARKAGELLYSEELRYLNSNYAFNPSLRLELVTSHRKGIVGTLIVKCKRKVLSWVWDFLKDYFEAERDFHVHSIRYLNDVAKYVDARDAANFWELIKKIDVDVTRALERIEHIADEQMASLRSSERSLHDELNKTSGELLAEITTAQGVQAKVQEQIGILESVVRGVEATLARYGHQYSPMSISNIQDVQAQLQELNSGEPADTNGKPLPDCSYLLLENRYRGSEASIKERQQFYPELFVDSKNSGKVLEIGPGRGELLELFGESDIPAFGVDIDQAMVDVCNEKQLEAYVGDGLAHLSALEDNSVSGVIALQVVEHLTRQQLQELFQLCSKKVVSGGKVVFETINPRSLLALSSNYFRDPTHVWPLHPDTLEYAMSLAGLKVKEIKFLSPVPDEARLRSLKKERFMTPGQQQIIDGVNGTIEQLNELLYGYQDYCIVAEVA